MFFFVLLIFFSFILKSSHLLSMLISLEFFGLLIYLLLALLLLEKFVGLNLLVALLVAMGCESVVGLVSFVVLSRRYSKDYFLSVGAVTF